MPKASSASQLSSSHPLQATQGGGGAYPTPPSHPLQGSSGQGASNPGMMRPPATSTQIPRTGSSSSVTSHHSAVVPGFPHSSHSAATSRNTSAASSPAPTPTDLSPVHNAGGAGAGGGAFKGSGVNIDHSRHFQSPATRKRFLSPYGPR